METPGSLAHSAPQPCLPSSLLMREFQHRMGNSLAVLYASLRREFAAIDDPRVREALQRHERHIVAVAELHRFFSESAGSAETPVDLYFQSLCSVLSRSILAPLGLHCEAFVGKGALPGEKCEWLGLAIGELVMNAAKHAFPGDRAGRIRIEIFACGSHWRCTISDNGVGMQDTHRGCGSRIIDSLVDALGGQLAICSAPEGTAVSIAFAA